MSHTYFLFMSYAAAALAVAAEIAWLALRHRRALARIDEEKDLETQD